MWTCPLCNQQFIKTNQSHSCNDRELMDFFKGKSEHCLQLFHAFVAKFNSIGPITVHPTKSMIAFAAKKRMVYLTRVGKDFIDFSFMFDKAHHDNLCFYRIAQVPGTQQFNHYFRMCAAEDVNEEVMMYMRKLYEANSHS